MGTTSRVSVSNSGTQGNLDSWSPIISGDGRYIVFESDGRNLVPRDFNNSRDIFVHDPRISHKLT